MLNAVLYEIQQDYPKIAPNVIIVVNSCIRVKKLGIRICNKIYNILYYLYEQIAAIINLTTNLASLIISVILSLIFAPKDLFKVMRNNYSYISLKTMVKQVIHFRSECTKNLNKIFIYKHIPKFWYILTYYIQFWIWVREYGSYILFKIYICLFILACSGRIRLKFTLFPETIGEPLVLVYFGIVLIIIFLSYLHYIFENEIFEMNYQIAIFLKAYLGLAVFRNILIKKSVWDALTSNILFTFIF